VIRSVTSPNQGASALCFLPEQPRPFRILSAYVAIDMTAAFGNSLFGLLITYGGVSNVVLLTAPAEIPQASAVSNVCTFSLDIANQSLTNTAGAVIQQVRIPDLLITPQMKVGIGDVNSDGGAQLTSIHWVIDDEPGRSPR
jgi:hypothetical protein